MITRSVFIGEIASFDERTEELKQAVDGIYIAENRLWTSLSKENVDDAQMKALIDHIHQQFQRPDGFKTIDKQLIIRCYAEQGLATMEKSKLAFHIALNQLLLVQDRWIT